jgi:hypothetical protein
MSMKSGIPAPPAAGTRLVLWFAVTLSVLAGPVRLSHAGLSEAERITLEQPACAQMRSWSQDITLLNDEMQNLKRTRDRRRTCEVLRRAVATIGETVGYMRSHIGECTITAASTEQMADLVRQLENDGRRSCR